MDRWWGKDEESYLDEDGKPISKEDYFKQFENQDKSPVEPEYPEQPQFVGDPTQFKPMPFDPNNPMMYMGSGSPFYHLQGGDDDYDWQGLAGRLGTVLEDSVHDMFLSPEEIEKKRLKKEACKLCHEGEETVGGASPFYHLRGSGKLDEMTVRQLIDYGKSLGVKGLDGKTRDVIITKIEAGPKDAKKVKTTVPPSADGNPSEERWRQLPEGLSETDYKELLEEVYKLYIAESLVSLKAKAKEYKITKIPHKNKETLAREVAKKHVEAEIDEILNPPKKQAKKKRRNRDESGEWSDNEPIEMTWAEHDAETQRRAQSLLEQNARVREYEKMGDKRPMMAIRDAGGVTHYVKAYGKPTLPPQDVLESKKDNPVVEEIIEEPMDDGDIRAYFPNAKIIRYSSLAKMSDIEQLLPRDKTYAFLLYEDSPGSGHWVVVLRYGTTIEFFCSYGSKIDGPLRWYNPKDNVMLGQNKPYLSLLLKKADKKFKAIHNAVPFQSSKHGVATCGAWDVMRVNQLVNHNQDLHEFQSYMEDVKKETGLTYDEIVANYVSKR